MVLLLQLVYEIVDLLGPNGFALQWRINKWGYEGRTRIINPKVLPLIHRVILL